nr:hypothetical protein [Spirochaetales bacterium]
GENLAGVIYENVYHTTGHRREKARERMRAEIARYNAWLIGEVWTVSAVNPETTEAAGPHMAYGKKKLEEMKKELRRELQ